MQQTGYDTFQTSDGCSIAYKLHRMLQPNPVRIVLIHSLALDATVWNAVAKELTRHAEVLTYDCRGHGNSGRQATTFTTDLFARDLGQLLDHVGWETAMVAGCSMGGCVAQAFAGLYSSRVSALALIDTTAWYGEDAPRTWRERGAAAAAKGFAGLVDFQVTRWFGDEFRSTHPDLVAEVVRIFVSNDMDCYVASCAMLGDADLRPYLPKLHMPVAIVVGEEDYATPVPLSQQMHAAISDSTLTILPKARHLTPIECPDQIVDQLVGLAKRM
jgi:3-oxoadipate enol-lactonase